MKTFYLSEINILAVIASAVGYWLFGSIWFSMLFGKTWVRELEDHGISIQKPSNGGLAKMMITTFILNLLVAGGVAWLVIATGAETLANALCLGFTIWLCFSFATLGINHTWESRSWKLTLIDSGYNLTGILLCSILLTLWR